MEGGQPRSVPHSPIFSMKKEENGRNRRKEKKREERGKKKKERIKKKKGERVSLSSLSHLSLHLLFLVFHFTFSLYKFLSSLSLYNFLSRLFLSLHGALSLKILWITRGSRCLDKLRSINWSKEDSWTYHIIVVYHNFLLSIIIYNFYVLSWLGRCTTIFNKMCRAEHLDPKFIDWGVDWLLYLGLWSIGIRIPLYDH